MNLTKKGRVTAIITAIIICFAIIFSASLIFVPNLYKNKDTDVERMASPYSSYADGGYGMSKNITFDKSNMALALARTYENTDDHVWIYFPSNIYMDVSENLQSLRYNYYFYAHYGDSENTDYFHTLFHSALGYYFDGNGNKNGKYDTALSNNANMDKFFDGYTMIGAANADIGLEYPSPDPYGGAKNTDKDYKLQRNGNWVWKSDGQEGDDVAYTVSAYSGGVYLNIPNANNNKFYMRTDSRMFGTVAKGADGNYKTGSFEYNRLSGSPIFLTRHYEGSNIFNKSVKFKWVLTKTESASEVEKYIKDNNGNLRYWPTAVSTDIPIVDDVKININLYNKEPLLKAMQTLDSKYSAISKTGLLASTESLRYEDIKRRVTETLGKREVTQAQITALTEEVTGYVFNTYIAEPNLGTKQNPQTVTYTGSTYSLNSFWKDYYKENTIGSSNKLSDYFVSGTMYYSLNSFDSGTNPVANDKKDSITEAGYYRVTFTPISADKAITVDGYSIRVKFSWADGSTTPKTAYLKINPAEMSLKNMSSTPQSFVYNGNTPNVVSGLGEGVEIELKGGVKAYTVQLSSVERETKDPNKIANAWNGVGDSVEFKDVTDGAVKVYYRITAVNHNDKFGNFLVRINPANISLKLKDFNQLYYSKLLTSDEIFDKMLDESTPNILDATSFAETKEYLKKILTFAIEKEEGGYFDPAIDKPDAKNYSVDAIKTTDEKWAKRINEISFVEDTNINAYKISSRPIEVEWTKNVNKWYDNDRGHRPSAKPVAGQETYGQNVILTDVTVLGNKGTALVNGNAVNVGTYTARVSSTNDNFTVTNNTFEFSILPRKITIKIQDRSIVYASYGGIENAHDAYYNTILAENADNKAYIATLDNEIATATGKTNALVHDDYKEVFTVNFIATAMTPDKNYYNVGEHKLELVSKNDNYDITAIDGKFTVTPATLRVTSRQVAPKVYNGEAQDIVFNVRIKNTEIGEQGTVSLSGYELDNYKNCVKVEYSSSGNDGTWSETPLQITNVIQSGMTVHCRVSANNHTSVTFDFKQEMSAVNITITIDGQKYPVYYGDPIPSSEKIWNDLGFDYYLNERTVQEGELSPNMFRKVDPSMIFEFYLHNSTTGQPIVNNNANAGKYTIESRIKTGTSFDSRNYNLEFENECNINAYTISKKQLQVIWAQNGDNWTGEGKDHYIYNGLLPTVIPSVNIDEVVEGDSINLAHKELSSSNHNEEGYMVSTELTNSRNKINYVLVDTSHVFYIDQLEVKIVIYDQTAEYGTAQSVKLGELSDPMSGGAIWDYAQGSDARFYSDHFSYFKFVSKAQSSDGSLVDVGDYAIEIGDNKKSGVSSIDAEVIRNNYKYEVVTNEDGKSATFHIIPAKIEYTGRVFNVAYDEGESTVLEKQTLIDGLSIGVKGVGMGQFVVKMSQKFLQRDDSVTVENATWVDATEEVTKDIDCDRYYVLLYVTHNNTPKNFEDLVEKIELNILSNWVSIIVDGGVTDAEYGYPTHNSDQLFASLDILSIAGFKDENGGQLWNSGEDGPAKAKALLKEYLSLRVIKDTLDSKMETNASVGDYSIYFDIIKKDEEYKNFRFRPRSGETENSNINSYHVQQRTVKIDWYGMNEYYGEHGNSHTGYKITNIVGTDVVRLELEHDIDRSYDVNTAGFVGDHAFYAGYYVARAIGVTNSNYRVVINEDKENPDEKYETCHFEIYKKVIDVKLNDREFIYGVDEAKIDGIDETLNVYSAIPNYEVISRTPFVGSDKRTDIFEIYYFDAKGLIKENNIQYLPAGTYEIQGRQVSTQISINYEVNFEFGTLTVNSAKAGLNRRQLNTLYFDATYQEVIINRDWLVLEGDVSTFINDVQIGYKFKTFETDDSYVNRADTQYVPEREYKVKNAGKYVLEVEIIAKNHDALYAEVSLNVAVATVVISMTQAEKTYGDTITDLNGQTPENTDTLSKWIKYACGITITRVRDLGGGKKELKDITESAIDDFIFYIIDEKSSEDNAELRVGNFQVDVGEYSIYHKMNENRVGEDGEIEPALSTNYNVEYDEDCNTNAYKITPRAVRVIWSVPEADEKNWADSNHTQYYYTGHRPALVATFTTLADKDGVKHDVTLTLSGLDNYNVNPDGEKYTARVSQTAWNVNEYSDNYVLTYNTYQYSVIKRPLRVTIDNQTAGTYGDVMGDIEIAQGEFSIYDIMAETDIERLTGNPIELALEKHGISADKFLPAGTYNISGICHSGNYDVDFVGESGGEYGLLTVNKAKFDFDSTVTYKTKYLGEEFSLDAKSILHVDEDAFVDGDDWRSAWANAQITYVEQPSVDKLTFDRAGTFSVKYKLTFANYRDFSGTLKVEVQRGNVYVSLTKVSSVYGDDLLDSQKIFANSKVALAKGSDGVVTPIDQIIELYVDASAYNVGVYGIEFNYVGNQEANFNVELVGNSDKYEITARVVEIVWGMDDEDGALDSDGKYVFDGKPHSIKFDVTNVVEGDENTIDARFEETSQKDQAGTYIAKLLSIGTNDNYAMPEDCSYEWTIKPRPVKVKWTVEEYTYDGTEKAPTAQFKEDEILQGTSCGLTVTGEEVDAGTYYAKALTTSDNYVVSNATQSYTIKPKQIQVEWTDDTFVYDGELHTPTATVTDGQLLDGETVEINVGGAQKNAGTYTASVVGLDNSNYIVLGASKTFTIEKKQITIDWTVTQFDYTGGEITPNASVKFGDIVSGDSIDLVISGAQVDAGTYTATATGVTNDNYVLAPNSVKEMEFTIYKGNNEFEGLYGKGDSKTEIVGVPWLGDNKPTDKFGGEVTIKYFEDQECTKEIDVNKVKDGTYWAVAYVEGNDNYDAIQSAPLKFTIDNGINIGFAVCGIVISLVLLGAVLAIILVINGKKKKGGNV